MNLLELNHVEKSFGDLSVLKDISLSVSEGEIVSIIGPSGSGKSTLLRCATMLETMDHGEIVYLGKRAAWTGADGKVSYADKKDMKEIRSQYGLVFQNFNLFPHYSVLKNITDAPIHVQKRDKETVYKEARELLKKMGLEDKEEAATGERKLSVDEVKSLIFLLLSIVLWFFGYNAVTSKYSVYASNILHKDYNLTLIIAQAAAIISYLPVGFIASRVGRKKTILAGVVMLTAAFTTASFMNAESPTMLMNAMFALAGVAWATINVNSFPMVVEMCSGGNVGKYTGFYYTASMAAQVATPMLSGLLMDRMGMHVLFPYAAVFTALAFVTMLFVRHGDSKPEAKWGLEALDEMED